MNNSEILFEEKQYLGHNRFSMLVRTVLTLFCFVGYYWSENPRPVQVSFVTIGSYPISDVSNSGLIFFILGLCILVLSAALTFVLHIHTTITSKHILLEGFWTSRKIILEFENIGSIRKSRYKKSIWRRASYNLHNKGIIRFYNSGEDFIELTDQRGYTYKVGSQRVDELYHIIQHQVKKLKIPLE